MKARLLMQLLLEAEPEDVTLTAKEKASLKLEEQKALLEEKSAKLLAGVDFVIPTMAGPVKLTAEHSAAVLDLDADGEKFLGLHDGCERPESEDHAKKREKKEKKPAHSDAE